MKERYKKIIIIFFLLTTIFLGVSFVFWTIIPNLQSIVFYKTYAKFTGSHDEEGLLNSKFIFSPDTYIQPRLRYEFMDLIFKDQSNGSGSSKELILFAKNKLEENTEIEGNYANNFLALGKAYDLLAEIDVKDGQTLRKSAEASYKRALDIMPGMQRMIYAYSIDLVNQDRLDEALALAKSAIDEDPRVAESHYYYGVILYNKGGWNNKNQALKEIEFAFNNGYMESDPLARVIYERLLVDCYNQKDISSLKTVLSRLITLNPNEAEVYKKIINYMDTYKIVPILNLHN